MKTYIGIDLGGTFVKYGLVGEVGEIIEKGKVPTPRGADMRKRRKLLRPRRVGLQSLARRYVV